MNNLVFSKARRAVGRSLSDFKNLTWAEKKLIACARRGKNCRLGKFAPDEPTRANAVRPELIGFLALGGDDEAPVHEKGVMLSGAYVGAEKSGNPQRSLDLEGAKLSESIWLVGCQFDAPIILRDTEGRNIGLDQSVFPGIEGDRLILSGGLSLRRVRSSGCVKLHGARIGNNLDCSGGRFEEVDGRTLSCDAVEVKNGVYLGKGFHATGAVRLPGARIGGNLECSGGRFENNGGNALICHAAEIKGGVFLRDGFHSTGAVFLVDARIGGKMECDGGRFENAGGFALTCEGAEIGGALLFRAGASVTGILSLAHAKVATLADEINCWPEDALELDGFRYDRIAASAPLDAKKRISWLKKQHPMLLRSETFALQPWIQLAKVLREQGHFRDASDVDIAREDHLRSDGLVGDCLALSKWMREWRRIGADVPHEGILIRLGNLIEWSLHWIYGFFSGYGHRPMRIVYATFCFWLAFAGFYDIAASRGHFAPPNPAIAKALPENACRYPAPVNWTQCEALRAVYPRFSPWAYSLDLILPVVHLGQSNMWAPISDSNWFSLSAWTQRFVWFEEIFGWIAALTLGGIATGLVKRRDG